MIHKTSIINSNAKIAENVEIGPYCVIGPKVEIKVIQLFIHMLSISGKTIIGKGNKIYSFSSIGNHPQDLKYNKEETELSLLVTIIPLENMLL